MTFDQFETEGPSPEAEDIADKIDRDGSDFNFSLANFAYYNEYITAFAGSDEAFLRARLGDYAEGLADMIIGQGDVKAEELQFVHNLYRPNSPYNMNIEPKSDEDIGGLLYELFEKMDLPNKCGYIVDTCDNMRWYVRNIELYEHEAYGHSYSSTMNNHIGDTLDLLYLCTADDLAEMDYPYFDTDTNMEDSSLNLISRFYGEVIAAYPAGYANHLKALSGLNVLNGISFARPAHMPAMPVLKRPVTQVGNVFEVQFRKPSRPGPAG